MLNYHESKAAFYDKETTNAEGLLESMEPLRQQERGKTEIFCHLMITLMHRMRPESIMGRISAIHISGDAGIGKSMVVDLLRDYFEMSPQNDRYSKQFVRLHVSSFHDRYCADIITGPRRGFIGYKDEEVEEDNLVTRLIKATERVDEGIDNPFIILHFDEACKGGPLFMNAINPLLSGGELVSSSGRIFTLPAGTLLFCIFTTNFAAAGILSEANSRHEAIDILRKRMIESGLRESDVARMGRQIFFRPVEQNIPGLVSDLSLLHI